MSSLNVTPSPWRAYPGPETTIAQLTAAIMAFPQLVIDVAPVTMEISLSVDFQADPPPTTADLAAVMFPDDDELITSEDTVAGLRALDQEAQDRHAEQDLDLGDLDPDSA